MTSPTTAAELAKALYDDPKRAAGVCRHYRALLEAMNSSHENGEQDALCVFEAVAMLLGQQTANLDDAARAGIRVFVTDRATHHAAGFLRSGKAARHVDGDGP